MEDGERGHVIRGRVVGGSLALLTAMQVLAVMALSPQVEAKNLPGPAQVGVSCTGTAWANVGIQANVVPITGGGGVSCFMPIPRGTTTSGGRVGPSTGGSVQNGQPCTMHVEEPVTFVTSGSTIDATFADPTDGHIVDDRWTDTGAGTDAGYMHYAGTHAGTQDVLVPYTYYGGTYRNGTCQGGHWMEASAIDPTGVCSQGQGMYQADGECVVSRTHLPQPVAAPPPPDGNLLNLLGQIARNARGGQIHSSPSNQGVLQGLVNLETRFWIDGETLQNGARFLIVVPGQPDASGRAIIFQYVVTISLQSVRWDYDDGTIDPSGQVGDPPPRQLHTYDVISDRGCQACGPNRTYHVTATLSYGMDVWAVWTIGDGNPQQRHLTNLSRTFPVDAIPEDLYVGQLEGVPNS